MQVGDLVSFRGLSSKLIIVSMAFSVVIVLDCDGNELVVGIEDLEPVK